MMHDAPSNRCEWRLNWSMRDLMASSDLMASVPLAYEGNSDTLLPNTQRLMKRRDMSLGETSTKARNGHDADQERTGRGKRHFAGLLPRVG